MTANPAAIRRRASCVALLFAVSLAVIPHCPGAAGERDGRSLALCIGVGEYDNLPPIATADAAAVNQGGLFDASGDFRRVFVLTGNGANGNADQASRLPTRDNILRTLKLLANNATPGGGLSVYFNGYGLTRDGKAFLLPSDAPASPLDAPEPGIPLAEVLAIMKNSRADTKTLILDVCRNGEFAFDANDELVGLGDDFTVTVTYDPGQAEPSAAAIIDMADGEAGLTSHMIHPIDAGSEKAGLRLVRADDLGGKVAPGLLSPTQAFEILRPDMGKITLARLGTSCSCIEVVAAKRTYAKGERAILELRNIAPTPPRGMYYSLYVLVASPERVTLRQTTFVQSENRGTGE